MAETKTFNAAELNQFSGTENWYRHALNRKVTYTDGAKYVADSAGAYWLLDEIAINNMFDKKLKAEEFQVWKFVVDGSCGVLTCEDGNGHKVFTKQIEFTDFPAPEITLWFTGGVIMLPGEY